MILEIGDADKISDPSAEQLRRGLEQVSTDAPFLVLAKADDEFIQCIDTGVGYRIEHHSAGEAVFTVVPVEKARVLFESYRAGDDRFRTDASWEPFDYRAPKVSPILLIVLGIALLVLIAYGIFSFWRS